MVSFSEAVRNGINRVECFILSNNPFVNGSASNFSDAERAVFNDRINQARAVRGCDPATPTAPPPPPFTGGQCTCSVYSVRVDIAFTEDGVEETSFLIRRVRGPLVGVTASDNGTRPTYTFTANNIGDNTSTSPPCRTGLPPISRTFTPSAGFPDPGSVTVTSIAPTLVEGPDDCGDPDPIYPPPTNINIDIPITFSPDFGPDIDVTIPFEFSPTEVNFNGDLRVPFTFNFGGFNFNGDFSFDPTVPIRINLPGLGGGGGQGTETQPPDQPGESVDPQPPDRKIIGVVVTATAIQQGRVSSYESPGIPEIYVPRLGSVKFAYNLGGATFFSSDIDVKDRRTFIECPFTGGADAVIASPQVGVDFSFLPIRGFPVVTTGDLFING